MPGATCAAWAAPTMKSSKKKHLRPAYLARGRVYRYCPPPGSPHPSSPLRGVVNRPCMLLWDDGTFAVVTFGGDSMTWLSADYLREEP